MQRLTYHHDKESFRACKGPTPNFSQKYQKKKKSIEKASSGMGEMCPKILGGYEY